MLQTGLNRVKACEWRSPAAGSQVKSHPWDSPGRERRVFFWRLEQGTYLIAQRINQVFMLQLPKLCWYYLGILRMNNFFRCLLIGSLTWSVDLGMKLFASAQSHALQWMEYEQIFNDC